VYLNRVRPSIRPTSGWYSTSRVMKMEIEDGEDGGASF
jgi:hypothetical protein